MVFSLILSLFDFQYSDVCKSKNKIFLITSFTLPSSHIVRMPSVNRLIMVSHTLINKLFYDFLALFQIEWQKTIWFVVLNKEKEDASIEIVGWKRYLVGFIINQYFLLIDDLLDV